jgi:hypothetical protein
MFNLFGCNSSVTGTAQSAYSPVKAHRHQPAILYGTQQGKVNEKVSDRTLVLKKIDSRKSCLLYSGPILRRHTT